MEVIAILRRLWRRRIAAAVGILLAVAAGLVIGRGQAQTIGLASARVVVNIPRSQVLNLSPTGNLKLPNHAPLLADLLATDSGRRQLAARAGVALDQLAVVDQPLKTPLLATSLPVAATKAAAATGASYTLTIDPSIGVLPILGLDGQAPHGAGAARLVLAAERVMEEMASRARGPTLTHGLFVTPLGTPRVHEVVHGTRRLYKVAAAVVILALWCMLILVIPVKRPRRDAAALRRLVIRAGGCGAFASCAAILSISSVSLAPPHIAQRQLAVATAETHVLIDAPSASAPARQPLSTILDPAALTQDVGALIGRAQLLSSVMASPPVVAEIARRVGVGPNSIYAYEGPTPGIPVELMEATSEKRSMQLTALDRPYLLEIQPRRTDPIIDLYAEAPTPAGAQRLVEAGIAGLGDYIRTLARVQGVSPRAPQVQLLQLGPARGVQVASGTSTIAGLTFVTALLLSWCSLVLWRKWRLSRLAPPAGVRRAARASDDRRRRPRAGGNWPHTTRVLPWLLAFFIAVLWFVPFDQIQLNASLPIGLPLDRLILPLIMGTWILALVIGGVAAPRLHFTWIHAAVGMFAVCAVLSVVLNAPGLNHTLELTAGLKRVPLFISYLSVFVIVASVVRGEEVDAFLKYVLVLAVILAVAMLVEYRSGYNVFYDLTHKLLPSVFKFGAGDSGGVDTIGRKAIIGSSGIPLEAVAMLSMGLSIGLAALLRAQRWGARVWYGLAVCLVLAAMVATARKSALFAPAAIILTLLWFRPRQMLRLAPLGVVLLGAVHLAAPGATGTLTAQVTTKLNVSTVSDRIVRYDAVRPDVWSHLAFGRGLGTYNHIGHRILDSEFLGRIVETGVFGTVTYFLMMIAVVAVARRVIRSGDQTRAPAALAAAAAALAFAVLSFLYDTLSFPHGPYLFLCMAGFAAVVSEGQAAPPSTPRRPWRPPRGAHAHPFEGVGGNGQAGHTGRLRAPAGSEPLRPADAFQRTQLLQSMQALEPTHPSQFEMDPDLRARPRPAAPGADPAPAPARVRGREALIGIILIKAWKMILARRRRQSS